MKFRPVDPPRRFSVGAQGHIELSHVADVELEPDEVVTFKTRSGSESDVTRKSWGYYWTGSLDERLPAHGLHAVIVRDGRGKRFLMLIEDGREEEFLAYCAEQGLEPEQWLDGR
jgi:hypothetical protein